MLNYLVNSRLSMADKLERQLELGQQRRITWLLIIISATGFLLIGRLAWFQLFARLQGHAQYTMAIQPARGDILDANGHYLASSTYACNVFFRPDKFDDEPTRRALEARLTNTIEKLLFGEGMPEDKIKEKFPKYVPELEPFLVNVETGQPTPLFTELEGALFKELDSYRALAILLSDMLNEPRNQITEILHGSRDRRHTLSTGVPQEVCHALEALGNEIIVVEPGFQRIYPDSTLLAHVLGFINFENQAQYGVERYYDRYLRGKAGQWRGILHPSGERLLAVLGGYQPAQDGADLVLTIDRAVQYEAERILREAIAKSGATAGTLIVLDPHTGAVLAMANMPTYHPGTFWEADPTTWRNDAISALYEPGSVIKTLTIAAALEARVIRPDTTYEDQGSIIVGGETIYNADNKAHGLTNMTEVLAYSLNVGAAHVATLLGPARFYEALKRFGFSDPTGIDLAAEERGILRVPGDPEWHMSDLGPNSFGQGMSATPLQVAVAYGALANKGIIRRPYVVAAIREGDKITPLARDWGRQVISEQVAEQVTTLLVDAVKMGMQPALVPGYVIAGKSGTSQTVRDGEYQEGNYIGSFVGYGPVPENRFVILVKLEGLKENQWGISEAGPPFAKMFKFLMDYYGIPPND